MTVESAITRPSWTSTGTSGWPLSRSTGLRFAGIDVLPLHVQALVREGEGHPLDVRRERNR